MPRAPFAALLLSFLALTAPGIAQAPLQAIEPGRQLPPLLDPIPERPPRATAPRAVPVDGGIVVGGGMATGPAVDAPRYQAALDAARATAGAWGVTFAVARDGELLWSGASGRAREGATALAPDSRLVIGSVMKTFVAAAVLQLVDEGRVELDAPVARYVPAASVTGREITIAQLLDHTSGLADLFNDATRRGLEEEPARAWTPAEVLATVRDPWYAPGEGWAYSNTNYLLLAMVVEEVTALPLEEVVRARFTEPLNLAGAAVLTGAPGDALAPAWTTIFRGSGAMVASAADLARWGDALYSGSVLRPATRAAMLDVNDHDYGLGLQRLELAGVVGYGHTGLLNTDTTLLLHLPTDGVTVALLVNRSHVDLGAMLSAAPPGGPSLIELISEPAPGS